MSLVERMAAHYERRRRAAHVGRYSAYAPPRYSPKKNGQNEFGENFTRRGEVLITPQQQALLETIREAPEQTFRTIRAWVQNALPLLESSSPRAARRCVHRMPEIWVSRTSYRRGRLCALQARGRAIIEGEVAVWVRGKGRYSNTGRPQLLHERELLSRMSLGQLLDWITAVGAQLAEATETEEEHHARARLAEGEVVLSSWQSARTRQRQRAEKERLTRSQVAAEQGDLQRFVRSVGLVGPRSLASAARYALSFDRPEQQLLGLEEVVLVAEAHRLGFDEAQARRQRHRDRQLYDLKRRLTEVIPA